MRNLLNCPGCEKDSVDLRAYRSMMVLSRDVALFTNSCQNCGKIVSSLSAIPDGLRDEISRAAWELGAGMGCVG